MVKVAFRYKPELVAWIKATGAGCVWNKDEKVWEVPESIVDDLKAKADEMNVEIRIGGGSGPSPATTNGKTTMPPPREAYDKQIEKQGYMEWDQPRPKQQYATTTGDRPADQASPRGGQLREGEIRLRRSRDGRFVLISMNLIAFASDVEDLISGKKDSVKFRLLPPRPPQQSNT